MKQNKISIAVILALILITALAAVLHLNTRVSSAEGTLRIEAGDTVKELPLSELSLLSVQGTVVNGKGEEQKIDAQGVALSTVLTQANIAAYTQVTVVADDEYSASVSAEEVNTDGKVFLLLTEDARPQMIVFGDPNSKRNVSSVARLVVS